MPTHDRNSKLSVYAAARRTRNLFDQGIYENDTHFFIARSLAEAHNTMETLQLYAKSIVRMLEACDAEADALQQLNRMPKQRKSMDLGFVRADIDRLVGAAQAQLALVNSKLEAADRSP